jgi:hypothetical protein
MLIPYSYSCVNKIDPAMREHDSKIQNFNNHALSLISQLHARGEQNQDLLVNLLKGHKACKDVEFVDYIKESKTCTHKAVKLENLLA